MKSGLLSLAIGAALGLASTVALADRDDDHRHYRDGGRGDHRDDYRGDYRVDEPRRWDPPQGHFRHDHYRPHWRHHWQHHVHDRWCGHLPPPVRFVPRYMEPRRLSHEGWHYDSSGRITLIISSDLN